MKKNSDNFRNSSVLSIIELISSYEIDIVIFEPLLELDFFNGARIVRSIAEFKEISDVIIANRFCDEISDVKSKVYTRDLFFRD